MITPIRCVLTIFALIAGYLCMKNQYWKYRYPAKLMGWFNPPPHPIIYLVTWIFNIDFLCTGNQQINANMVNKDSEQYYQCYAVGLIRNSSRVTSLIQNNPRPTRSLQQGTHIICIMQLSESTAPDSQLETPRQGDY